MPQFMPPAGLFFEKKLRKKLLGSALIVVGWFMLSFKFYVVVLI